MWRLFASYLSFFVFGLCAVVLGLVLLPLAFIFIRNRDRRKKIARSTIGYAFGWFTRLVKGLGAIDFKIQGMQYVPSTSNRMIIANHPSLFDVVFLLSIFPMVDCVVKNAVVYNPFLRGVARPADYISNDDTASFLENSTNRLKAGGTLLLFPEGTRSVPHQPLSFKMGAASIAVRAGAEILPVVIKCTPSGYLSKHKPWYWVPEQKPFFDIQIQPPLSLKDLIGQTHSQRDAAHKLNAALTVYYTNQLDP